MKSSQLANSTSFDAFVADPKGTYDAWMTMGDKRVDDWLLMRSPWPTVAISAVYVVFCNVAPRILKGRTFNIQKLVLVYNACVTCLNAKIAYELLSNTWGKYNWHCQPVDYSRSESAMTVANFIWWFYFSKVIEMLDSIFFILRGSYRQVSFLHVYHHSTMFIIWWIAARFVPGGISVWSASQNSIIHVAMYSYYFLSALGDRFKKFLFWKRFLTQAQIIQFCINLYFAVNFLLYETCDFPRWMQWLMAGYMISYIFLFGNFYIASYIRKGGAKSSRDASKKRE